MILIRNDIISGANEL